MLEEEVCDGTVVLVSSMEFTVRICYERKSPARAGKSVGPTKNRHFSEKIAGSAGYTTDPRWDLIGQFIEAHMVTSATSCWDLIDKGESTTRELSPLP